MAGWRSMGPLGKIHNIAVFIRSSELLYNEWKDLAGKVIHQGMAVYGNKGSTDQHAYVQQLRDGLPNFFVTFIEVLQDRPAKSMAVEPNITSGDYLEGFLLGTRKALGENGRESVTLTLKSVSPSSIGVLIALFERTVGLYATFINVNAYNQPGVEAGKKAAAEVIEIQRSVLHFLTDNRPKACSLSTMAGIAGTQDLETVFKICEHLASNERGLKKNPGTNPFDATYQAL